MATIEQTYNKEVTKKFLCKINHAHIKEKVEEELKKMAPQIKMKGFRDGKVPMDDIRKHYGNELYNNASKEAMKSVVQDIVKENNYNLVSDPSIEMHEAEEENIAFEVTCELLPTVPSDFPFDGIEVETFDVDITPEEVAKEIERMAKTHRSFATKEGEAEMGDTVIIDTVGRVDRAEFEGGKLESYSLELGSGQFIPGFEEQLVGASANTDVIVTVTFPDNYHAKNLAGKEAQFFTHVKEVKKVEKEALDDNFAKKLSFENLDALKAEVEKKMKNYYANAHKETLKPVVFDSIGKALDFEVPEKMSQSVAESIKKEKNIETEEMDDILKEAEEKLRLSFFLNHFAKEMNLSLTQEDFTNYIIQTAQDHGIDPIAIVNYYSQNKEEEKRLRILLEENKIFEYIMNKVKVNKKPISKEQLDEILSQKKA